jgi:hypothetical protein
MSVTIEVVAPVPKVMSPIMTGEYVQNPPFPPLRKGGIGAAFPPFSKGGLGGFSFGHNFGQLTCALELPPLEMRTRGSALENNVENG